MTDLPGLPSLPGGLASLFGDVTLLVGDLIGNAFGGATPQWGIFLNGGPVILCDNVVSFDYKQDFAISNYPVEQGAFASYNKVQKPFEVKFRFSTGGSLSDRQNFLDSIDAIIADTNLYDVVTPEKTYTNVNLVHQDYRRTATDGVGLISVDVWCEQVRAAAQIQSSSVAGASSSTPPNTVGANSASGGSAPFQSNNAGMTDDFAQINNPQSVGASPQVNGGTAFSQSPTVTQQSEFNNAMPLP